MSASDMKTFKDLHPMFQSGEQSSVMTSVGVPRVRDSPFRESEWDRRLDDMLEDLGGGGGGAVARLPGGGGGGGVTQQGSSQHHSSYSYSSSSQLQQHQQVARPSVCNVFISSI